MALFYLLPSDLNFDSNLVETHYSVAQVPARQLKG